MVVGSGASYADVTSEENQEAIEVLQAVGVMVGDDEGNFNPDRNVTRAQMATVMANLLDLKVEDFNAADIPFTDVPSWAVPYVAACYADGITAGVSDTLYGSDSTVTAAQAALMMMKALGYFQYQGDFEQDWTLATIKKGSEIGIFDGITVDRTSPLTRNDVAQMALNALKSNMVTFTGEVGIEIPTANGNVVVGYNPEYTARTSANSKYNRIDVGTTDIASNNQYYVQLGEDLYDGDLRLQNGSADVFGRPSRTWSLDGEEIGTYMNESLLVAEYTTAASGKALYEDIGKTAFDKYEFYSYVDGEDSDMYKEISRNNNKDVSNTADGALTQVFVDSDAEAVVVTVINTYLAKATADYNEKKDEVSFTVYGLSGTKKVSGEDFYIADIAEDDFVLVTYADKEIQSISDVEILSDVEISKFSTSGGTVTAVTVDGTKYNDSAKLVYDSEVLDEYTKNNMKDTTYNVYLDQYGYVIGVDIVDAVDNYVFITGIDSSGSNLSTKNYEANAIFLDGTSDVITIKNNDAINSADGALINSWFTYTVNSSDVYTLTAITKTDDILAAGYSGKATVAQYNSDENDIKEINDKHISVPAINGKKAYGNDDSVYLLAELDKVTNGGDFAVIKGVDEVVVGVDNTSFTIWVGARSTGKSV